MRIAFVTQPWDSTLPSNGGPSGSIGILTNELARRLASRGHHVRVYGGAPNPTLRTRSERVQGVEFCAVPATHLESKLFDRYAGAADKLVGSPPPDRPRYASAPYLAGYASQIARSIRRWNADIVHIHNLFQLVPAIRTAIASAKVVVHMHCEWLSQIASDIIAERLAQTDMMIGVSEHITGRVRRRFPSYADRCRTIYNGVEVGIGESPKPYAGRTADEPRRLLFVGRVSPEKGVHVLIEALARVLPCHPDVTLDILGPIAALPWNSLVGLTDDPSVASLADFYTGPQGYEQQVVSLIRSASLGDRVRLLGSRPYQETAAHYRNADIFVNASYSDAFPLPPLEAMASGLPVVAARVGGIPEQVIDGTTGILCDVGRADQLAQAIGFLLGDAPRRASMGAAGRQRATETFSWDRIIDRIESSYHELLA